MIRGNLMRKGGTGEERYMSNMQFLCMIAGIVSLHFPVDVTDE
jgi:hypothetical protein